MKKKQLDKIIKDIESRKESMLEEARGVLSELIDEFPTKTAAHNHIGQFTSGPVNHALKRPGTTIDCVLGYLRLFRDKM